ncbi:MAG: homoserine O-succinyltransferase [Clostridiales Family XIII bacterium]|nr:homoserine O-succinyltransferase [Clostridiales Family XIII bacterium]
MPILVPNGLPAYDTLKDENVFVMYKDRAQSQEIRPLKIAIVNLMPIKEITETQLIRMLANTPLQVNLELLTLSTHESKHTNRLHMDTFYRTFDQIREERFDGIIITGAPVETLPFEDVDYWSELKAIMDYSRTNVFSTLHLCWGAQAAMYYHFGINKEVLPQKIFGVFEHSVIDKRSEFVRGFDEYFYAPHSRYTQLPRKAVAADPRLNILAESDEAGLHIVETRDKRMLFLQGHFEYDWDTLKLEYDRDKTRGLDVEVPANYFKDDDPKKWVVMKWSGHANLFFANWLNFVYQETPYDLKELDNYWKAAGI